MLAAGKGESALRAVLSTAVFVLVASSASLASALSLGDYLVSDVTRRAIFRVDAATGDRTVISGCANASCTTTVGTGSTLFAPTGLARADTLNLAAPIYVTDTLTDSLIRIDPTTGARTIVSSSFVGSGLAFVSPTSVTVQANGNLLVVDESLSALIDVNATTGDRTVVAGCVDALCSSEIGAGTSLTSPHDLSIELGSGDSFVLSADLDAIFRVDGVTGDRILLSSAIAGSGPNFVNPRNLALDASGQILVSDSNVSPAAPGMIFRVDPLTGARTIVASDTVGAGRDLEVPVGLGIDQNGNIIVLDFAPGIILSIDPTTGDRAIVSSSQQGTGLSFAGPSSIVVIPVPEPSTALLVVSGLAALGQRARNQKTDRIERDEREEPVGRNAETWRWGRRGRRPQTGAL